jgi:hypothetical protein
MNAKLFGFLLFFVVLHSFTQIGIAEETRIWSAILPMPPAHVIGLDRFVGCSILNVSKKAIRDVELAMFSPAKLGNASLGSGGIGSLEPERSLIIFAGSVPAGINNVFCRATFDGKRRDVRGSVTAFTEDQVPIFTITFE